jgi:hypothetical protein
MIVNFNSLRMNNFVFHDISVSFRDNHPSDITVRGFYPVWRMLADTDDLLLGIVQQAGILS